MVNDGAQVCLGCGAKVGTGNKFCGNCGASHAPEASVCLRCGAALKGGNGASGDSFMDILKYSIKKSFSFEGRASRKDFWYVYAAIFVVNFLLSTVVGSIFGIFFVGVVAVTGGLGIILYPLIFIPSIITCLPLIGLSVRRMHDIGKSGWYSLLYWLGPLTCLITTIVYFVFACKESDCGNNEYGPAPIN